MTRFAMLAAVLLPAAAVGQVVPPLLPFVAPPQVQPDEPAPTPADGKGDPLKTIERITKSARAVGDRLHDEDAGSDTQKAQDQLLRDIDSLLPPPMGGGGGGGGGGNGGDPPPPTGGNGGGGGGSPPPPMGGGGSKRPRGEQGGADKRPMDAGGSGGTKDPQPMPLGSGGGTKDPMPAGGGAGGKEPMGGGGTPGGGGRPKPELPLDDPFSKRVWGHLPEQVRQQAMQSYREQFMPQYADMLKQYYATLNERQTGRPNK